MRGSAAEARLSKGKILGIALAVFAVGVSLLNASWLAPRPKGKLIIVAHRGLAQQFSREGLGLQDCTASRIRPPEHHYLENTVEGVKQAYYLRANAVELDVQQTREGNVVAFHDADLSCRTNGKGRVRDHTVQQLKALDAGYGYTADGGKTYPLRGRIGAIPTIEEVLRAVPRQMLIFHFKTSDPSDADALAAAFVRAGLEIDDKFAFYGAGKVLARMRRYAPNAWMWDQKQARACPMDYLKWGWTGFVPESCRGATVGLPLNYRWAAWGWPNRFLDRMADAGARVILFGDLENVNAPVGLERPEQLGKVPRSFRGYLWVEDIYNVGRALKR